MMTISNTSMPSALLLSDMPANSSLGGQMNIQLSTVEGEQISLSESEFFSMLSQNLIQLVSDEDGQVIDNKELMTMLGELEVGMDTPPDEILPAEWMQFLKSHFSQQTESGQSDRLVANGTDQDEEDVTPLIEEVSVDAVDVDPVAMPIVIPTSNLKGDALPPGRQSLSTRTPQISTVTNIGSDPVSDIASEESDIDPKSL